ncbi:MAG: hypothetical protein JXA24_06410 [Proteobacteria bacterium]|nr:hypothetical protein [Pseudomonadota bacterium]
MRQGPIAQAPSPAFGLDWAAASGSFVLPEVAMENDERALHTRSAAGARIDAVCWGLFFIWIGAILLFKTIPRGMGALGVGAIILGGAVVRLVAGVTVSMFWLIIGTVFVLAGVGEIYAINLPLLPAALIICGVLLLFHKRSARRGK